MILATASFDTFSKILAWFIIAFLIKCFIDGVKDPEKHAFKKNIDRFDLGYIEPEMPFEDDNERGCVYILINESFPELVKIGRTGGSVSRRVGQLNSTGIPTPFECHYAAYVGDMHHVEKYLHDHFAEYRVNEKREFFKVSPKEVHKVLSNYAVGDATFS